MRRIRVSIPHSKTLFSYVRWIGSEFKDFFLFLRTYLQEKAYRFSVFFEGNKNSVVKSILIKRGKRNRIFLHISAMVLLAIGVLISPFVTDSNPFSKDKNILTFAQEVAVPELESSDVFQTQITEKRSKIIPYTVEKGDTISTIAKKFEITTDTIKWANNLTGDSITVGDTLEILPVTGIAHKVERGDSVYSIAKKYSVNAQEIVDFPFTEFVNPQTFSLVEGQIVVVPNGVKPEEKPRFTRPRYIATGPVSVTDAGFTWPVQGSINQFYSWYHKAIDIGSDIGVPVLSAQSGQVSEVYTGGWNGGYGTHVIVAGANGYSTLYAHMSGVNVGVGDAVAAGKTVIGWVGMTGRTTGSHLHFEIRGNGLLNPLSFLR